jgi:hypothetical protein
MNKITALPGHGALTFRALLVFTGHDPARFAVKKESGGVSVEGGGTAVTYTHDAWVAQFGRDLYQGVYGPAEPHRS